MKIAFQFSGGKDSTAALFLLEEQWPTMHFYSLDSGDMFPETKAFIVRVAQLLPNHTWVYGRQEEIIQQFGPPSDLVPFDSSEEAHALGLGHGPRLQNRVNCCMRSKMMPMQQRMLEDEITHIVRGQRKADKYKGPLQSGQRDGMFTVIYPIENWSDEEVMNYLRHIDQMPPLYADGVLRSGDCMTCSAWLGDARPQYLRQHHPDEYKTLYARLELIDRAIDQDVDNLEKAKYKSLGNL